MEILETLLKHMLKDRFDLELKIALDIHFISCLATVVWTVGPLLWIVPRSCLRLKGVGAMLWRRARAWSRPTQQET